MKLKHVKLVLGGLALFAGGICAGHLISAKKAKKSSKSAKSADIEDDPLLKYYKDGDEDPFYDESLFEGPHASGQATAPGDDQDEFGYDTAGGYEGQLKDEYSCHCSSFNVKGVDKALWPDSPERLNPKYLPDLYARNFGDDTPVDPFVAFARGFILGYNEANADDSLADLGRVISTLPAVRVFMNSAYNYVLEHSIYVQRYAGTPYALFIAGYHAAFDIYFNRYPECSGISELHYALHDLLSYRVGYSATDDSIFGEDFDPEGDTCFRTGSEEDYKLTPDDFEELYNKSALCREGSPFDCFVVGYREGYTKATEGFLGWKSWLEAPLDPASEFLRTRFDVHCPDEETDIDTLSNFIAGYHAAYDDVFARNPELITGTDGFHHQLYDFMFNEDSIWDMAGDLYEDDEEDDDCCGAHSCDHCHCHHTEPDLGDCHCRDTEPGSGDDAFTFEDVSDASYIEMHKDDDMHKESSYFMDLYLYYFDAVCDPNAIFPGSAFEKGYCEGYTDATCGLDGWKVINKAPTKALKDFVARRWAAEKTTSEYIEALNDADATPYSAFVAGYHAAYDDAFARRDHHAQDELRSLMHEDTVAANNYMNLDDSDAKESNEFFNFDAARKLAGEDDPLFMNTDSGAGMRSPKINGGDFAKNDAIDLEDEFEDLSTTRNTDVHESRNEHAVVGQDCKKCKHCPYTCDCSECICGGPCLGCKERNEFEPLGSNESTDADALEDDLLESEDVPTSTEEFFNEDGPEFEDEDDDPDSKLFPSVSEDELLDGSDIEENNYELENADYVKEETTERETGCLCEETADETSGNSEEDDKSPKVNPATDALSESEKLDDDWG